MSYLFIGTPLRDAVQAPANEDGAILGLAIDLDRCIACRACEVHCQLEHDLPPEVRPMQVVSVLPFACAHCADPPCAAVCPTGAIAKRADGLVLLDEARCIGCRFCIVACPYGSPKYDARGNRVVKCDLCVTRMDWGYWPACATKCSMKAIHLLDPERLRRLRAENRVRGGGELILDGAGSGTGVQR
ncbi:MAG: 4Fe-4S binding protein [Candidatus Rokubacteria bacterium]|nr:4Fe-4S binding protein [Candidatus Rokubacteria bacterium]